jgi:ribonuclease P protein component
LSILTVRGLQAAVFLSSKAYLREADLSAQRAQTEAEARLSRAHVDPGRSPDPKAPPGEGPEAAFRLTATAVQRRYRLSRSRDFDAVYRHGRSVSTRFLVLYWFPRDDDGEPRLGIAVPKGSGSAVERNRVKRRLREAWRSRIGQVPAGRDYVLIARPALGEALAGHDASWLGQRVDEVLGKAAVAVGSTEATRARARATPPPEQGAQ